MNLGQQVNLLRQRLEEMLPGYTIESDIQLCEFFTEYQLGVDVYMELPAPSGVDERWVALCFMACGQRERALEHFLKSIASGHEMARIDLVRLFGILGRYDEAVEELRILSPEDLQGYNQAFWYRNRSFIHSLRGDNTSALADMNTAWKIIQGVPEFRFVAPKILVGLTEAYNYEGNKEKALYYIGRAEEMALGNIKWSVLMTKAQLLFAVGKWDAVHEVCVYIKSKSGILQHEIFSCFMLGQVALVKNNLTMAEDWFLEALDISKKHLFEGFEFILHGYLSSIYKLQKQNLKAKKAINRMQKMVSTPLSENIYKMRKTYIDLDELNAANGLDILLQILEFRKNEKDLDETVRIYIHLCNFCLRHNLNLLDEYIKIMLEMMIKDDSLYVAFDEWIFFPELYEYVQRKYDKILPEYNSIIYIYSIDREDIVLREQIMKIPLSKTFELIVYLLCHGESSLASILTDVFVDMDTQKAKNYFHQIRHILASKNHVIQIVFDKTSKRYRIKSAHPIVWDLQDYLQGKHKMSGIFLPSSGSDWVIELNQRLSE
ncbi:tetratricopeptide repeat protein [Deinococcus cellulosilyticus]|uniref:Uncharacterized protein n=1 Tax=Deinococcus cellulosilyticus (strain DSM 18568 / NBRC 106333 / KACC 11606 / 5516J-15) TaxID=1223518 RepID=A0A511N8D2_DEIC1|nr:hypothetical protein [Deinococcus cellulosilyticus]GEM49080.1 hypothetical protein DC3_47150 [Deinococcus cellulosilyticus NBRC 106333 = KACC 11606]